jgi:hypothetical protein
MIVDSLDVDVAELEHRTGWAMRPEGACKGDVCIPLAADVVAGGRVDLRRLTQQLRMPVLHDEAHALWALGPESGGRALTTAVAPDLVLPDRAGNPFSLASLRGQKVLLVAWASW